MDDSSYMALAVELAERGVGWVSPNPLVGAVLVKDGCVHRPGGGMSGAAGSTRSGPPWPTCREDPAGAVLYVTLEPCCHTGRQPPCTEAILAAGIRRVVVGSMDPNPLVAGKGVELLRTHGGGGGDRGAAGAVRRAEPGVLPLYPHQTPLCGDEVRHDPGREDRRLYRGLPVDHQGGGTAARPTRCGTGTGASWPAWARCSRTTLC